MPWVELRALEAERDGLWELIRANRLPHDAPERASICALEGRLRDMRRELRAEA